MGEKLVIHPTRSRHFEFLFTQLDEARRMNARERNVVGSAPRACRLLAHAVLPMDDGRFRRTQGKVQLKSLVDCLQLLRALFPNNLPVAIPDAPTGFINARNSGSGSVCSFGVVKLATFQIAQRQMRDVDIFYVPGRCLCGIAADGLPKKSQLESEAAPIVRFQVSRVVPPLRLKFRVIEVVAWEFVVVTRQSRAVLRRRMEIKHQGGEARQLILHAQPQWDSAAPPLARGTSPQARLPHTRW